MNKTRVQTLREMLGLTRAEFASPLHVRSITVRRWEEGTTNVPRNRLAQIAHTFECTLPYLEGTSDSPFPEPEPSDDEGLWLPWSLAEMMTDMCKRVSLHELQMLAVALKPHPGAEEANAAEWTAGQWYDRLRRIRAGGADPVGETEDQRRAESRSHPDWAEDEGELDE